MSSVPGEIGPIKHGAGGQRQRVKPKKQPKPYKLGVWVALWPDDPEHRMYVRTVENRSDGRVLCLTRGGAELTVPRSLLP